MTNIKFTLEHGVDFRSGKAVVGKVHVIQKREEIVNASYAKRIQEAAEKNRIVGGDK